MSFILDALRKSETERRKAQGPGIGDAPMVVHQKHVPRWTVGLIASLSVGLVVVGWFWLRDTGTGTDRDPVGVAASSAPTMTGGAASTSDAVAGADVPTAPPASIAPAIAPDSRPAGEVSDLSAEALLATAAPDPAGVRSAPTSQAAAPSPQAVSTAAPESLAAPMLTLAQYRASGGAPAGTEPGTARLQPRRGRAVRVHQLVEIRGGPDAGRRTPPRRHHRGWRGAGPPRDGRCCCQGSEGRTAAVPASGESLPSLERTAGKCLQLDDHFRRRIGQADYRAPRRYLTLSAKDQWSMPLILV